MEKENEEYIKIVRNSLPSRKVTPAVKLLLKKHPQLKAFLGSKAKRRALEKTLQPQPQP